MRNTLVVNRLQGVSIPRRNRTLYCVLDVPEDGVALPRRLWYVGTWAEMAARLFWNCVDLVTYLHRSLTVFDAWVTVHGTRMVVGGKEDTR